MRKIFFLILFIPIFLGANTMEINDEAKKVIYQYAEIVDSRNFDELDSIMWPNFSMTGGYDLKGIEGFKGAMDNSKACLMFPAIYQSIRKKIFYR